jgi:hypothetical protein
MAKPKYKVYDARIGCVYREGRNIWYAYVGGHSEADKVERLTPEEVEAVLKRWDEKGIR